MHNNQKGNILVIVLILAVLIALGAWLIRFRYMATAPIPTPEITPTQTPGIATYIRGVFAGTLPCADCSGISTIVTLMSSGPFMDMGTFKLEQVYIGKSTQPFITEGSWTVNRGMPGDENASVVELYTSDGAPSQHFLRINEDTLEMLDVNQMRIDTSLYTLTRQTGPSVPTASELDAKLTSTKEGLIGVWQDQLDPHFQTEFKADGIQIDSYNGEEQTSTSGTWVLFTANSNEPTQFQLNNNDVYIKQVMGTVTTYFRIANIGTTDLQLVNMDKGGILQFKKLQ